MTPQSIIIIILFLVTVNSLSFVLTRFLFRHTIMGDELTTIYQEYSDLCNYFISGLASQPAAAFNFLLSRIEYDNSTFFTHKDPDRKNPIPGNIKLAPFRHSGWNPKNVAKAIQRDIVTFGYCHINIFTISLGDHVARELEASLQQLPEHLRSTYKIYAINPCPSLNALQPSRLKTALTHLTPLLSLATLILGWLAALPLIPVDGHRQRYSLALTADQLRVLRRNHPLLPPAHTVGVILSNYDQYLNNQLLHSYYENARTIYINTRHGTTITQADEYYEALLFLLLTT